MLHWWQILQDNFVLVPELIRQTGHYKEILELTFQALALPLLWRRVKAWNISFTSSLQKPIHMISSVYVANLTSNLPAWQQESHSEPLGEKVLQLPSWRMAGFLLVGFRLQWHATVGKIKDKLKNLSRYKAGRSWFSIFNVCVLTQYFRCLYYLQDYANILLIYHFLNHLTQNEHFFAARHDSVNVFISWHNKISKSEAIQTAIDRVWLRS